MVHSHLEANTGDDLRFYSLERRPAQMNWQPFKQLPVFLLLQRIRGGTGANLQMAKCLLRFFKHRVTKGNPSGTYLFDFIHITTVTPASLG